MRIGLDFDNTIVNYDHVFHLVAREGGHVPVDLPRGKLSVRDFLRRAGKEEIWTEMQGYVYGARMSDAVPYPGAVDFMRWAGGAGHELRIISHKTRHPYLGVKYDLHRSAREWVGQVLHTNGRPLISPEHVFFDLTIAESSSASAARLVISLSTTCRKFCWRPNFLLASSASCSIPTRIIAS